MDFQNTTHLDADRLQRLVLRHTAPYAHDQLCVRVRHSRGADFSGKCFYREGRILVNLGEHVKYPYTFNTLIAKAQAREKYWFRPAYRVTVADGYQLALFVYLHELFHYLAYVSGRSPRRKESMCDRFAVLVLADEYRCPITDEEGRSVPRDTWDFKDLHTFVAKAPKANDIPAVAARRPIPVKIHL